MIILDIIIWVMIAFIGIMIYILALNEIEHHECTEPKYLSGKGKWGPGMTVYSKKNPKGVSEFTDDGE